MTFLETDSGYISSRYVIRLLRTEGAWFVYYDNGSDGGAGANATDANVKTFLEMVAKR